MADKPNQKQFEKMSLIERLRDGGSDWIARQRQTPDLSTNTVWIEVRWTLHFSCDKFQPREEECLEDL